MHKLGRLREKYCGNETAFDLLVYHMVTDGGRVKDVESKLRTAMSFLSSDQGQEWYDNAVAVHGGTPPTRPPSGGVVESDYSHEWAQAAQHKDGLMVLKPGMVSSEHFTLQALSSFSKRL